MSTLQIIIFDPSEIVREGIKNILSRLNQNLAFDDVVCEEDLVALLKVNQNRVVFLTLTSSRVNGHRIAVSLLRSFKKLKLILIAADLSNPLLAQLIHLGARSVLSLYSDSKEVEDAFRSVIVGDRYLFGTEEISSGKTMVISPQEYRIIQLLARGKTSKEISAVLNKTSKTIETYRSRLLKKTGSRNTSELLCFFIKHNLSSVP